MITKKLQWLIPLFLCCFFSIQPLRAERDKGGLVVSNESTDEVSRSVVKTYWDVEYKEMTIDVPESVGTLKVTIQGNGQTVYSATLAPKSFLIIPLWQASVGSYTMTFTNSYGNQTSQTFILL